MKARVEQWLRDWLMDFACGWLNRVSEMWLDVATHDYLPMDENGATWLDHLRWKLEEPFSWLFGVAFNGSNVEIRQVYEGILAPSHMSERQLEELFKYDLNSIGAACLCCQWNGYVSELEGEDYGVCPECGESGYINLEAFEPGDVDEPCVWDTYHELRAMTEGHRCDLPPLIRAIQTGPLLLTEGRSA